MYWTRPLMCAALTAAAFTTAVPSARAQNQAPRFETKTEVTVSVEAPRSKTPGEYLLSFNTPVGLPGVSLATGTYVFRYLGAGRDVIQVLSADGKKNYGMFAPASITRTSNTNEPAIWMLRPAVDGAPTRIQAWFEPGKSIGSEFLYMRGLIGATQ